MRRRDFFKVLGSFVAVAAAGPMPSFAAVESKPAAVEGKTVFYRRRTPGYAAERPVLAEAAEVMERRLPVAAEVFGAIRGVPYGCRIDWE